MNLCKQCKTDVLPQRSAVINQSGAAAGYLHQHLIRAYNSSWGDPVEWLADGRYETTVSLDVPNNVNRDNLEVIAFISKDNPSDRHDCKVLNTSRQKNITIGDSGVGIVEAKQITKTEYFNLSGSKVSDKAEGILIAVDYFEDGSTKARKIIKPF